PLSPAMNERRHRESKLFAETFHPAWSDGETAQFARTAAARARLRRGLRRAATIAGAAALVIAVGIMIAARKSSVSMTVVRQTAAPRAFDLVSDDEFLVQLRDRPLLVVKTRDGGNQFVLLDPPAEQ